MKLSSTVSYFASAAIFLTTLSAAPATIENGKKKVETCFACHGANGNSVTGMFPVLAGQNAGYTYLQLKKFKEGSRVNPLMSPIAAALSNDDMQNMADFFAVQKSIRPNFEPDPARVALGAQKAEDRMCGECHMSRFEGRDAIPKLAGQQPDYIKTQLHNYKTGGRHNDEGNMNSMAQGLSDEDINNLTHFIGSLL